MKFTTISGLVGLALPLLVESAAIYPREYYGQLSDAVYWEETTKLYTSGSCRVWDNPAMNTGNNSLPCTDYCMKQAGQGNGTSHKYNREYCQVVEPEVQEMSPGGDTYKIGACHCDLPEVVVELVEDVIEALPAIASIGCEIMMDGLGAVLDVASFVVPEVGTPAEIGARAAVLFAKTVSENGGDALDFVNAITNPCGSNKYTQMVDDDFSKFTDILDPFQGGLGCITKKCRGDKGPGGPSSIPKPSDPPATSNPSPPETSKDPQPTSSKAPTSVTSQKSQQSGGSSGNPSTKSSTDSPRGPPGSNGPSSHPTGSTNGPSSTGHATSSSGQESASHSETGTSKPTDTGKASGTNQPTSTGNPTGTGQPSGTGKPTDTSNPTVSSKPTDSGKPTDTSKPTLTTTNQSAGPSNTSSNSPTSVSDKSSATSGSTSPTSGSSTASSTPSACTRPSTPSPSGSPAKRDDTACYNIPSADGVQEIIDALKNYKPGDTGPNTLLDKIIPSFMTNPNPGSGNSIFYIGSGVEGALVQQTVNDKVTVGNAFHGYGKFPFDPNLEPMKSINAEGLTHTWFQATSNTFARQASGRVYLVHDGDYTTATGGNGEPSIFNTDELPNLKANNNVEAVYQMTKEIAQWWITKENGQDTVGALQLVQNEGDLEHAQLNTQSLPVFQIYSK